MFSQWNFSWPRVNFFVLLSHIPCKKSEELPLACLYFKFSLGYDYPHPLFV